ncbi:hypothetical protein NCPPB1935_12315 [Xanthomonas campestris pv. nigromaculans]|nr:hypothetical protein NCPPB1935_12315 [Xanthomonas campestris pv. nigromaculans]
MSTSTAMTRILLKFRDFPLTWALNGEKWK